MHIWWDFPLNYATLFSVEKNKIDICKHQFAAGAYMEMVNNADQLLLQILYHNFMGGVKLPYR